MCARGSRRSNRHSRESFIYLARGGLERARSYVQKDQVKFARSNSPDYHMTDIEPTYERSVADVDPRVV